MCVGRALLRLHQEPGGGGGTDWTGLENTSQDKTGRRKGHVGTDTGCFVFFMFLYFFPLVYISGSVSFKVNDAGRTSCG